MGNTRISASGRRADRSTTRRARSARTCFTTTHRSLRGRIVATAALWVALAMGSAALEAQSPVSLGVGAGVTMPRDDLESSTDRGYHGMATLRLGVPLVPVHLRADLMHGQLGGVSGAGDVQITSATLNVGYDVIPLAVFSVYAVAGGGYYWTKLDVPGADRVRNSGWNAGAGVRLSLGAVRLFAEARYHAIQVDNGNARVVPVTFGLMF